MTWQDRRDALVFLGVWLLVCLAFIAACEGTRRDRGDRGDR